MSFITIEGQIWPPAHSSEISAELLGTCLEGLAQLNPLFTNWTRIGTKRHRSAVPKTITLPPDKAELHAWIDENARFVSRDGRKQHAGNRVNALTPEGNPVRADFWLTIDCKDSAWWTANRARLVLFTDGSESPSMERANAKSQTVFFRQTLLILATSPACDWAGVAPADFRWKGKPPPPGPDLRYRGGWMVYVGSTLAKRIDLTQDVATEKLTNGAILLTAVTDEWFDPRKDDHFAAALRVQETLAPLNERQSTASGEVH